MLNIQMSKRSRFFLILVVLVLCFVFLWPSISWYGRTPKEVQAIALSSTEKIREQANSQAIEVVNTIKTIATNEPSTVLGPEYDWLIKAVKKECKRTKTRVPDKMTVSNITRILSENKCLQAAEEYYRNIYLDAKKNYNNSVKLGLDLAGGMNIIVRADLDKAVEMKKQDLASLENNSEEYLNAFDEAEYKKEAMSEAIRVLTEGVDRYGLASPVIRQQGADRIYIEVPGSSQTDAVTALIQGKGVLNFRLSDANATKAFNEYYNRYPTSTFNSKGELLKRDLVPEGFEVLGMYKKDAYGLDERTGFVVVSKDIALEGKHIKNADVSRTNAGDIVINFVLDKEGAEIFFDVTKENKDKTLSVVSENKVKSDATIAAVISDGNVQLSGAFTYDEAMNLKKVFQSSWLQVPLEVESQQVIGASLGEVAIRQGILAILLGLGLILIFMLIFYKGSGINAIVAQVLNLYIMFSILAGFNLTLTLSSIAGMILTIGMAVDANVLIFERIKEELRAGKSRAAAISMGFGNAFLAILDSNITTFIAAFFLAELGTGTIQGFAISLAIGVISSLFTALIVSRLIYDFDTDVLHAKKVSIGWGIKQ